MSAEDVDSLDRPAALLRRAGSFDRCVLVESSVRASGVVVLQVDGQDAVEVSGVADQQPVQAFDPRGAYPAFGVRVGPRARGGIFSTSIPAVANTESKTAVNLASRSLLGSVRAR
jgi:hypothetical protein